MNNLVNLIYFLNRCKNKFLLALIYKILMLKNIRYDTNTLISVIIYEN